MWGFPCSLADSGLGKRKVLKCKYVLDCFFLDLVLDGEIRKWMKELKCRYCMQTARKENTRSCIPELSYRGGRLSAWNAHREILCNQS